jgi:hypothetical protein
MDIIHDAEVNHLAEAWDEVRIFRLSRRLAREAEEGAPRGRS